MGTYSAGTTANGIAFDGVNMWVTNWYSNTVTKLRASDGTLLGSFATPPGPNAIAFDGADMWITSYYNATVNKM